MYRGATANVRPNKRSETREHCSKHYDTPSILEYNYYRYIVRMQLTRRQVYISLSLYHFLDLLWIVLPFNLNVKGQLETPKIRYNIYTIAHLNNRIRSSTSLEVFFHVPSMCIEERSPQHLDT